MKNGHENQIDVTPKCPVFQIFEIDFDLIRPDDIIIVSLWVGLLGEQFLFVAILDAGRTCDARTQLQDHAVVTLQLVSITRHIRSWPNEAHLSNQNINEFRQAVYFAVAQPMSHASNSRVASHRDAIALSLTAHSAELADFKRLATFSDAFLHKKNRAFRVKFYENGDDQQGQKQHNKPYECYNSVEAPLKKEPDSVFISLHVA